jgi:CRP-like cAMP-binding protein
MHGERSQLRLSRLTAHERVADFLAEIVGDEPAGATATYRIAMSRLDIADYLGLTLETVSRGLHRLDWMGVIELVDAHQFRVRNLNGLRRIAGGDRDGDVGRAA